MVLENIINANGNAYQVIRSINSLTEVNFIRVLCDYIDKADENNMSEFEYGYARYLETHIISLGKTLLRKELDSMDKDKLIERLISETVDGKNGFDCYCDDGDYEYILEYADIPAKEKLSIVKEYMEESLNDYCSLVTRSAKERKINLLEDDIERIDKNIKAGVELLAEKRKALSELKQSPQ